MGKKRTSISIDEDVYQYLQQSEINQSGLIEELVREYKDNNDRQVAALELRYKHLMSEHEEHKDKAETKLEQAKEVEALLSDARQTESEQLQEAKEVLGDMPPTELTPENPAVENWAEKLGMKPQQLIERIELE